MASPKQKDLTNIMMLVLDVDGVLTDGGLVIHGDGSETKIFNALDGHGIRMWRRAGKKVAFISGRASEPTIHRAKQLDVEYCFTDCHDKLQTLRQLVEKSGIPAENMAYVGDDVPDLPVIRAVGLGIAVANAVDRVKKQADYVTTTSGGTGAVREVVELILKSTGQWKGLMAGYTQ